MIPVSTAAEEYGISERTLYRYLADGKLSRFKAPLGDRRVYVDRRELARLTTPRKVKG